MNFSSLYNTYDEFNIKFSRPVYELVTSDTIKFPCVENWDVTEVENIRRVSPTYYIIECDECIIRLEDYRDEVYVLIHDTNQTMEIKKSIMYKGKPITDVDDKYATGISHIF